MTEFQLYSLTISFLCSFLPQEGLLLTVLRLNADNLALHEHHRAQSRFLQISEACSMSVAFRDLPKSSFSTSFNLVGHEAIPPAATLIDEIRSLSSTSIKTAIAEMA